MCRYVTQEALEQFRLFLRLPSLVQGGWLHGVVADGESVRWTGRDGVERSVDLRTGDVVDAPPAADSPTASAPEPGVPSPSGAHVAKVVDHNIVVVDQQSGQERTLTTGGTADQPWEVAFFTGNSSSLVAKQSDHRDRPTYPVVDWMTYPYEVRDVPQFPEIAPAPAPARLAFFDLETGDLTWAAQQADLQVHPIWGTEDGRWVVAVGYDYVNTYELLRYDTTTGEVVALMSDDVVNFVPYFYASSFALMTRPEGFDGALWASDRDGDLRLYAVPMDGSTPWPITPPGVQLSMPVAMDSFSTMHSYGATIALMALTDQARPYDVHVGLTNTAGEFRVVTSQPGVHTLAPVPGVDAFLDRHSGLDRPPQTDLRRFDGSLVATLEVADVSDVEAAGRQVPEEFVVKAADGTTDLHGVLYKPADFDPARTYPLIDVVYGGPQQISHPGSYVGFNGTYSPFTDWGGLANSFTRLGFVAIVVDGRGTPGRGRAFQAAAASGFATVTAADQVAAIRELALTRPWIDASRCGVLGHSFGGYHAVQCGLAAPDVFKAVVSAAGVFDPSLSDRTFFEGLLGVSYQEDPEAFAAAGVISRAKELEPELLIIAGTADVNVPLSQAMRFSDALVLAGKQHELVLLQNKDHALNGVHGEYALDRAAQFFWQHLGRS